MNLTISANSCTLNASSRFLCGRCSSARKHESKLVVVRAMADESVCNKEECALDKEVGKGSMEWLAGEKTKVVERIRRGNEGGLDVEKDTAGQTNICSVEVGNNEPLVQTAEYSRPSLSYFIDKFRPPVIIQALAPPLSNVPSAQAESPASEVSQIQAATGDQTKASS